MENPANKKRKDDTESDGHAKEWADRARVVDDESLEKSSPRQSNTPAEDREDVEEKSPDIKKKAQDEDGDADY